MIIVQVYILIIIYIIGMLNYDSYSNPNIHKEKRKFRTKTTEIIEKTKKSQLNQLQMHNIDSLYPNSKIQFVHSGNNNIDNNTNYIPVNTKIFNDKVNLSMVSNHSSKSHQSPNREERLIDQKTKHILRKNIVGRYKKSPYLK